jgi:hypothetical protein
MVIHSSKIVDDPAGNSLPDPDGDQNGSPVNAYSTHSRKRSLMVTQSLTAGQSSHYGEQISKKRGMIDSEDFTSNPRNVTSLTNYKSANGSVVTANEGSCITIVGTGTLQVQGITIDTVKHCPELSVNLLSVRSMCD